MSRLLRLCIVIALYALLLPMVGPVLDHHYVVTVQTWWVESVESRWKAVSMSVSDQDSSPILDLQTLGSPQV